MKYLTIQYLDKKYTNLLPEGMQWSFFSENFYKFANNCRRNGYHENDYIYQNVVDYCERLLIDNPIISEQEYADITLKLIGYWIAHTIPIEVNNDELDSINDIVIDLDYILKKLKVDRKSFAKQINSKIKESVKDWIFHLAHEKFNSKAKEFDLLRCNMRYDKYNLESIGSIIIDEENKISATPYYWMSEMQHAESKHIDPIGVVFEVFNSKEETIYGPEFTEFSKLNSETLTKIKIAIKDILSDQ